MNEFNERKQSALRYLLNQPTFFFLSHPSSSCFFVTLTSSQSFLQFLCYNKKQKKLTTVLVFSSQVKAVERLTIQAINNVNDYNVLVND